MVETRPVHFPPVLLVSSKSEQAVIIMAWYMLSLMLTTFQRWYTIPFGQPACQHLSYAQKEELRKGQWIFLWSANIWESTRQQTISYGLVITWYFFTLFLTEIENWLDLKYIFHTIKKTPDPQKPNKNQTIQNSTNTPQTNTKPTWKCILPALLWECFISMKVSWGLENTSAG